MCEMTLLLGLLSAVLSMGQDVGPLLLEKEIALPGVEGRIDHFSVDVLGQLVFIAALENGSVEILDTRQGERTAEIKGLEEPQGVYCDSQTGRLYVATGGDGKLRIYDDKSLTVRETLEFGDDADNVRYDRKLSDGFG
jgi:DNA-binding beta-propeller fold protein YncE